MRGWESISPVGQREPSALGVRLASVTLGHLFLLDDCGVDVSADWSVADSLTAVFICSNPTEKARRYLESWWVGRYFKLWGWVNRKRDWPTELAAFRDWFEGQLSGPITKSKSPRGGDDYAAPFRLNLLACAMAKLHLSRGEAMALPVRELRQLIVAIGEAEGVITPKTHKDFRLEDTLRLQKLYEQFQSEQRTN